MPAAGCLWLFDKERAYKGGLQEAPITAVVPIRLFHIWTGRNAWNNNWHETYNPDSSFALSFSPVANAAEQARTQGTTWSISELPALSFCGLKHSLIVTEINTQTPFSNYADPTRAPASLFTAYAWHLPLVPHSTVALFALRFNPQADEFSTPLRFWRSRPQGTAMPLAWDARWQYPIRFERALSLAKRYDALLHETKHAG